MGLRLFVCEYVTGGGLAGQSLPASLCREGDMMLGALVKDLRDLPGVELVLTRDARLTAPDGPPNGPVDVRWLGDGDDPWLIWRRIAAGADAAWPIAPETDGMLERLSDLILDAGCKLIGSRPDAVRLTASKSATAEHLSAFELPVVPTHTLSVDLPSGPDGWVVKPDDGAGTEETRLFRGRQELERWLDGVSDPGAFILQPFIPGEAASLSMLCRDGQARLLSCNRQHVRIVDGRLSYRGGVVGGMEHRRPAYEPIARAVAEAISGLWGHVGVDLVESADGPLLLEVNPRLTTSYVGLRSAIGANPAALVLDLLEHRVGTEQSLLKGESREFAVGGDDVR